MEKYGRRKVICEGKQTDIWSAGIFLDKKITQEMAEKHSREEAPTDRTLDLFESPFLLTLQQLICSQPWQL